MLCEVCSSIPVTLFTESQDSRSSIGPSQPALALPITRAQVTESAEAGCGLCQIFAVQVALHLGHETEEEMAKDTTTLNLQVSDHRDRSLNLFLINGTVRRKVGELRVCISSRNGKTISEEMFHPTCMRSDSATAFDICRSWLKECDNSHSPCIKSSGSSYIPSRLLYVSGQHDQDRMRLVETSSWEDSAPKYLTLSHCWGKGVPSSAQTTQLNRAQHLQCIAMENLPKTFQDLVYLAQKLQIQYVWIDSLCIVQDSKEDWEIESSRMSSIYQHSYCTIVAAAAADSSYGLFVERDPDIHQAVTLSPTTQTGNLNLNNAPLEYLSRPVDKWPSAKRGRRKWTSWRGEGAAILSRLRAKMQSAPTQESSHSDMTISIFRDEPSTDHDFTALRAWIYQERQLSPRMITYHQNSIKWHCLLCIASEQRPLIKNHSPYEVRSRINDIDSWGSSEELNHVTNWRTGENLWRSMMTEYSSMLLTFRKDRLPAISGLAKAVMAGNSKKTYAAGLWLDDFLYELRWERDTRISEDHGPEEHTYLAPSWSWVSLDAPIYWKEGSVSTTPSGLPPAILLSQSVTPAGKDPHGCFVRWFNQAVWVDSCD